MPCATYVSSGIYISAVRCTLPGDVERAKEQYQQRLRSADIAEPEEARAVLPKEQSESMQLGEVSPVGQRHRTSHTL